MEINGKLSGDLVSHFMVFVDNVDNGILSGVFYNDYMQDGPKEFCGLTQLFLLMDAWSSQINFPHEYFEPRYFMEEEVAQSKKVQIEEKKRAPVFQNHRLKEYGKIATFKIDILFRQNASWQGNVSWQEQKLQVSYRSCLELMRLIVSAVSYGGKAFEDVKL